MCTFNFTTVYMAILATNLLLVIIAVIIRNEKIMINAGYKLISIFLVLTLLRFMLPLEIPYATTFPLPTGISNIIIELFEPRFTVLSLKVSIFRMLLLIWFIGIFVHFNRFLKFNRLFQRFIFTFGRKVNHDPRYSVIIQSLKDNAHDAFPYQIYEVPDLPTPCLYGFLTPYILIPANMTYTDRELAFILRHEMTHYKHHDLWIKFGVQLISIVYWWNPSGSTLVKNMDMALDMRIDDTITGMNDAETLEYINCLYRTAKYQDNILNRKLGNVIAYSLHDRTRSERRLLMLINKKTKKKNWLNFVLVSIIFAVYVLSYLVTLEAYQPVSVVDVNIINISDTNSYLVDNGDGTYDLYFMNTKIDSLTSLDYYDETVPIYTREEFEYVQKIIQDEN